MLQILVLAALFGAGQTKAFAASSCELTQKQTDSTMRWTLTPDERIPVALRPGDNSFTLQCDLVTESVITFQRHGLFDYQLKQSGQLQPLLSSGEIAYRLAQGQSSVTLKLTAEIAYTTRFKLDSQQDFSMISQQHSLIMGVIYGLGITLFLLSLLVGWKIRALVLQLYSFYILCLTTFLILQEGQLFPFFGDAIARGHQLAYIVSIGVTVLSATWFFSNFLHLKQDFPLLNRILIVLSLSVCAAAILRACFIQQLPVSLMSAVMGYGTLVIVFLIFVVSIVQTWRRTREAGLICIALSVVLVSMVFRIMLMNYIPFIQRYGFVFALAIESIILAWALAQRVSRVTQEKDLAEHAANYDPLCGIANRRGLQSRLTELSKQPYDAALYAAFYIDADDFKTINDHYGHHTGDLALQHIATCLSQKMRPQDIFGRLGGDEFIAIVGFRSVAEVYKKHTELKLTMAAITFTTGKTTQTISASVGCTIFEVLPTKLDEIISASDHSMYMEKNNRKLGKV